MNTILTDDERPKLPGRRLDAKRHEEQYTVLEMEAYADAREAAVLAKLREQEPVAWQGRMRPTWGNGDALWGPWEDCTEGKFKDYQRVPKLHDWEYQSRALYAAPLPAVVQVPQGADFLQFLSDVTTAAGLLEHGRRDKGLAARIGDEAFRLRRATRVAVMQVPQDQVQTAAWNLLHAIEVARDARAGEEDWSDLNEKDDALRAALDAATESPAVVQVPPDLKERICEAHDASLDEDHRACRLILMECVRLIDAAAPEAPAQEKSNG